jgi:hypothetical protein
MSAPELDVFDTYTYLILCPISMLASLLLFFAHLFYKELRKQPGDLILMIALSEFALAFHWFLSALHTSLITKPYEDTDTFCTINSWIAVVAATMDTFYNIAFFAYIIFALKNSVKQGFMPRKSFHACTILIVLLILANTKRGRNKYGTCSSKLESGNLWTGALFMLISVLFSAWVYLYTKRSLPNFGAEMSAIRRDFLNFYGSYLKAYIIIISVVFTSMLIQTQADDQTSPTIRPKTMQGYLFNLGRLGNTAKALLPILLFFIRCQDPLVQKHVFKPLLGVQNTLRRFTFSNPKSPKKDPLNPEALDPALEGDSYDSMTPNQKTAFEAEMMNENSDDMLWMNLLSDKVKESFTRTFLAGIILTYPTLISELLHAVSVTDPDKSDSTGACRYDLEGEKMMALLETQESICSCEMTIYAPVLFKDVLVNSTKVVNFEHSLNIRDNAENIKKAGESKGGASGELFMFSHDSQIIIKTITQAEFIVFTDMLYDYSQFLKFNRHSLIAKIYGMFEFKFRGSDKAIKLIVMENLCTLPSPSVLRKYDLKGSTYSRRVVKNYQDFDRSVAAPETMKDIDFLNVDEALRFLHPQQRLDVVSRINRDVNFFKAHKIIDYSLFVVFVRRSHCSGAMLEQQLASSGFRVIQSQNPDHLYFLGIIDYFQLYTLSKRLEACWKKTKTCSPSLQTSSQPPRYYGDRFFSFVQKIML